MTIFLIRQRTWCVFFSQFLFIIICFVCINSFINNTVTDTIPGISLVTEIFLLSHSVPGYFLLSVYPLRIPLNIDDIYVYFVFILLFYFWLIYLFIHLNFSVFWHLAYILSQICFYFSVVSLHCFLIYYQWKVDKNQWRVNCKGYVIYDVVNYVQKSLPFASCCSLLQL